VIRKLIRWVGLCALIFSVLSLSGCNGNVGIGVGVGVPVGKHGYMSVGTSRWY
jgi:hypothetical protein